MLEAHAQLSRRILEKNQWKKKRKMDLEEAMKEGRIRL